MYELDENIGMVYPFYMKLEPQDSTLSWAHNVQRKTALQTWPKIH